MSLGSKIWLFAKSVVELERDDFGDYELLDNSDNILYIGYGRISSSLVSHFADGKHPVDGVFNFSVKYTWSEEKVKKQQQEELAKYFQKNKKYPKFNEQA